MRHGWNSRTSHEHVHDLRALVEALLTKIGDIMLRKASVGMLPVL